MFFGWKLLKLTQRFLSLYSNSDRPKGKHGRQADGKLSRGPVLRWGHAQIRKTKVKERGLCRLAFCKAERYCWARNSQGIQQTSRVSHTWQFKTRIMISTYSSTRFTASAYRRRRTMTKQLCHFITIELSKLIKYSVLFWDIAPSKHNIVNIKTGLAAIE